MPVIVAICLLLAESLASAQPSASAITGEVLAAGSDAPLRRARVQVSAGRLPFHPVFTDDEGRFAVAVTGTGPFAVTIEKAGYVIAKTSVSRADLETGMLVRLPRGAVISGAIIDQQGRPAPSQRVNIRLLDVEGPAAKEAPLTAVADDRGEFRVAGLGRGRYEVWAGLDPVLVTALSSAATPVTIRMSAGAPGASSDPQQVTVESGDEVSLRLSVTITDTDALVAQMLAERGSVSFPLNPVTPVGAAAISGRVISDSGEAVRGASLRLIRAGVEQPLRTTPDGRFSFSGVAAGEYTLEVSAPGYASARYGQRRAGDPGSLIRVRADERLEGLEVVLRRGAVVTGVIVDEHGEPIQGASVRAVRVQYRAGRLTAHRLFAERRTDDRGYYRLPGLLPGVYVLSATVDAAVIGIPMAPPVAYGPVYYPGVGDIGSAVGIVVEVDTVADFTLTPMPGGVVRGVARDGQGPLVAGSAQLVESRRWSLISGLPRETPLQPDGTFLFANVPAGNYVVQVLGDGPGRTGLFGTADVAVPSNGEPVDVTLATSYGTTLEGRVTIEGTLDPPGCLTGQGDGSSVRTACAGRPLDSFLVVPVPIDDRARPPRPGATFIVTGDSFSLTGLFGLSGFALRRSAGEEWHLKSVRINGIEVADTGFDFGAGGETIGNAELVISRRGASLSGSVVAGGTVVSDYYVVVFPPFRDQWLVPESRRMKLTRARGDGSFGVVGLPDGDYFVVAVDRLDGSFEGGEWQDPAILEQLAARAERVTLAEGQSREVTLRLVTR